MNPIKLDDFIENTLVDIAQGIRAANERMINPEKNQFAVFSLRQNIGDSSKIPGIQFDVGVTAAEKDSEKAGFFVALASLGGGARVDQEMSNKIVHRIKFEVGIDSRWM